MFTRNLTSLWFLFRMCVQVCCTLHLLYLKVVIGDIAGGTAPLSIPVLVRSSRRRHGDRDDRGRFGGGDGGRRGVRLPLPQPGIGGRFKMRFAAALGPGLPPLGPLPRPCRARHLDVGADGRGVAVDHGGLLEQSLLPRLIHKGMNCHVIAFHITFGFGRLAWSSENRRSQSHCASKFSAERFLRWRRCAA